MRVTADTNVLVRALTHDDPVQSGLAEGALANANIVALTLPALCELVCVLSTAYGISKADIANVLRRLVDSANVVVDRSAVEGGLALMAEGGDFADGVIAADGTRLGAEEFVSFDRQAVKLLKARGDAARLLE